MKRYLWVLPAAALLLSAAPTSVTLSGSFQSELGCSGDNDPACVTTDLAYSAANDRWTGTFTIPAGTFTYSAALNHAGTTVYPGSPISITGTGAAVKFYYDDTSHWVGDTINSTVGTVAGDFQSELGCGGDWDPACLRSMLNDANGDGIYSFTTSGIPAGSYSFKVAHDEAWTTSYGDQGGSNNFNFRVTQAGSPVTFSYNPRSHWTFLAGAAKLAGGAGTVTIAGTFQSELGCTGGGGGDWEPPCAITHLTYDAEDDLWEGTFNVPAGAQEFKAALNDSWTVSYGQNGGSSNVAFTMAAAGPVKFYYDDKTHDVKALQANEMAAVGDWQNQVGCLSSWDPTCLRGYLSDTDSDGVQDVVTPPIPAGTWHVKVTFAEDWAVNYGAGCAANGADIPFTVPAGPAQPVYFAFNPTTHCTTVNVGGRPRGDLRTAKAHWLDSTTIAWDLPAAPPANSVAELVYAPNAGLALDPAQGISGGAASLTLTRLATGLPAPLAAKFPHLANLQVFQLASVPANIKDILKGQVAVGLKDSMNVPLDATSVQIPGVLDDLYAAAAKPVQLGVTWAAGVPTMRVWAPTAKDVKLELYADADPATLPTEQPMTLDQATGVWSATGASRWKDQYYQYKATVFTRATRAVEVNTVVDPYSVDVSINAGRSHIVDLSDATLKPANWDALTKPPLASPLDIVLYELHIRDFSATDSTVPEGDPMNPADPMNHRGRYLAFTDQDSDGMLQLRTLVAAGLTHVHLLPAFDIASVNEDPTAWSKYDFNALRAEPHNSQNQQAYSSARQDTDGFNWGYDPVLFGAPEGSYATNPNGGARVLEFRQMVQSLNDIGLRTVMDVVYNHTSESGQNPRSVLDKIVPGYYHRLDLSGNQERSSCCENTATEHAMMGKLVVDTLVTWARDFKVSGFRFDLMGHMPKQVLVDAQTALRAVDPAIYLYGEGWNFGEVENNKQFVQAKQADMAGTGIGTFNDRIRDAVRGGNPFTAITDQGFASGLLTEPNAAAGEIGAQAQKSRLLAAQDLIRLSLAGNLKTFSLQDSSGATKTGEQLSYNGNPGAGYTAAPQESINYVSAHDNMTLFDAIQVKAKAEDDMAARIRYNNLALAIVMFSQGVPFFHAGDEILRSKSGDNNSYNSGDWFNRIDWSLQENGWGSGLPPQRDNGNNWNTLRPLLGNTAITPKSSDIQSAAGVFLDLLRIRKAEPLLRLPTAQAIQNQVQFRDTGATQTLGLIVEQLSVTKGQLSQGDLMLLFNGTPNDLSWQSTEFIGQNYVLHPLMADGSDDVVKAASFHPLTGKFDVPARSAVVYRNEGGSIDTQPPPIVPTCACATSGTNAALGMALLSLAALWRRRRGASRRQPTLSRYWKE